MSAWEVVKRLQLFAEIRAYSSRKSWRTGLNLAWQIRRAAADIAILLPQGREQPAEVARKSRFFQWCGVPDVRGHQLLKSPHNWNANEPERLLEILKAMGIGGAKPEYDIPVDRELQGAVAGKLRESDINPSMPFLIFCGGGKAETQRWPLTRYAGVLNQVHHDLKLPVLAVGTPAEMARYREEVLPVFPDLKFLRQSVTIPELFELLRLSTAYFGNDTGTMHVAAAVRCPVAAVISSRNAPGAWDPDVEPRLLFRHRTFCENCFLSECVEEKLRCLLAITGEEVVDQLVPFLKEMIVRTSPKLII